MPEKTIREIAEHINGEVVGDNKAVIRGVSGIKIAKEGDITFLANTKYAPLMEKTAASCIIVSQDLSYDGKIPIIKTENPSMAFSKAISFLNPDKTKRPKGIHPSAVVGEKIRFGQDVSLGAHVTIEDGVQIGDETAIYPGVYIGTNARIGKDCTIHPNVTIRENVTIGDRVIVHSGTVIGSDGFGYMEVEGVQNKIPQIGIVEIEDDVEIGACAAIDRARFDKTIIRRGTKIDNLVHIAHNVEIGADSLILAQCAIAGSTKLGKGVILAGQSGIVGHIEIGDKVIIGSQSGVTKDVPAGEIMLGSPAKPISLWKRINASMQRLPKLFAKIKDLENRIENIEKQKR
ncbi:MAG: UDP-3-O-(3-hydroxymyristoyl)glucosamine N-acyltransferase [Candidatus Omnitrophica bacterium]|nr:UDP-3-O-(3-hydroxymyristoyl)glucosamine N-acyltransferase [Candidatus Omnitrophota bacterium]